MENEPTTRTSISVDGDLMDAARARMKALKIRKFSQYVALLLEKDQREGGPIVVVKEEGGQYRHSKRKR